MTQSHDVLNDGHFVVIRDPSEDTDRGGFRRRAEPPRLYLVWYDLRRDQAFSAPISWDAARALAPEKFEAAMVALRAARKGGRMDPETWVNGSAPFADKDPT
jgi:hypothetical protein